MNRIPIIIGLLITLTILTSMKGDKPAYAIFDAAGKTTEYNKMIKALEGADVVFFGELHDDPIAHWLQLEVTVDLHKSKKEKLVLGAEMFESDNQLILDEYLDGVIAVKKFEDEARVWPNYKTDYKPLVSFAEENKLRFIATNIPRRYANLVYKKGFEAINDLTDQAKSYIAPMPVVYDSTIKCYADMLEMGAQMGHANPNLPKAQAIKDATMAHFILQNMKPGQSFIHYNGSYHSNNHEGIVWYLNKKKPELKVVTITTVLQKEVKSLEKDHKSTADFIIAIPETMTRTY